MKKKKIKFKANAAVLNVKTPSSMIQTPSFKNVFGLQIPSGYNVDTHTYIHTESKMPGVFCTNLIRFPRQISTVANLIPLELRL